jgi:hypothetical protein
MFLLFIPCFLLFIQVTHLPYFNVIFNLLEKYQENLIRSISKIPKVSSLITSIFEFECILKIHPEIRIFRCIKTIFG